MLRKRFAASLFIALCFSDVCVASENDRPICKYPTNFLSPDQSIAPLAIFAGCKKLNSYLSRIDLSEVHLVFVEPSTRSPMSYFGHTFLVFGSLDDPFSQVLSFSAVIPDEAGYFEVLLKGSVGELQGKYIFTPFHLVRDLYLTAELRNMSSYSLVLTDYQKTLLGLTVYEQYSEQYTYSFFFKNCATELIALFKQFDSGLRANSLLALAPANVVSDLSRSNLLSERIDIHYSDLEELFFLDNNPQPNQKALSDRKKDLEAKIAFKHLKAPLDDHYERRLKIFPQSDLNMPKDLTSASSLPNQKLWLGGFEEEGKNGLLLGYSPTFIDRYTSKLSLSNETTAKIFNIEAEVIKEQLSLREFDLLHLESYNKKAGQIWLPSWEFYVGRDRRLGTLDNSENFFRISYGKSIGNNAFIASLMPQYEWSASSGTHLMNIHAALGMWSKLGRLSVESVANIIANKTHYLDGTEFRYDLVFGGFYNLSFKVSPKRDWSVRFLYGF